MSELNSANRTNTGPGEILPGNLVWQSLEALKLELPGTVWNHHYDLVWSALKLQADEIERLRAGLQEIHDMGRAFDRRPPTALGERLAVKKAGEILRGSS